MQEGLTFDDVLLVPQYSKILPSETNAESKFSENIPLKIPIVSAAMDTVTEHRMAIAIALEGGLGIIHKNLSIEEQAQEVKLTKRFENGFINDPATVYDDALIDDIHNIFEKKGYKKIPVLDRADKLIGLITELDYFWPHDKDKRVIDVMTPIKELVIAPASTTLSQANKIIREKKLAILALVDKQGKLTSIVMRRDLEKNKKYPEANKDANKSLYVGAAIGVGGDSLERARTLVKNGVDVLVLDSAHGHSKGIIDMIGTLKKDQIIKNTDIVAGNIASAKAAQTLIKAGANGIKVGIGPGSICTTRVIAGIGVPQLTAISEAVRGRGKTKKIPLIADGGIRYSGDIVKALAAGADSIMAGGLLAGTEESPGETEFFNNKMYKIYRGMGSVDAMQAGSRDRYGQSSISEKAKFVPEGIEGRTLYKGKVDKILYQLIGGLRAGLGYNGAANICELQKKAEFVKISSAGFHESHPHNITMTKEAPNYKVPNA